MNETQPIILLIMKIPIDNPHRKKEALVVDYTICDNGHISFI